jgi:hypothetical protein
MASEAKTKPPFNSFAPFRIFPNQQQPIDFELIPSWLQCDPIAVNSAVGKSLVGMPLTILFNKSDNYQSRPFQPSTEHQTTGEFL